MSPRIHRNSLPLALPCVGFFGVFRGSGAGRKGSRVQEVEGFRLQVLWQVKFPPALGGISPLRGGVVAQEVGLGGAKTLLP